MGGFLLFGLSVVVCVVGVRAAELYTESDSVVELIDGNELEKLKKKGEPMLVKFFSPTCHHCHSFAPDYQKAAKALAGVMKVYATHDEAIMPGESVKSFPTLKFIAGTTATVFTKDRKLSNVVDFAMDQLTKLVNQRIGVSDSKKKTESDSKGAVVVLTDTNFEKTLKESPDDVWFVLFYAVWCGHCKAMMGDWERTAVALKGQAKIAKVDANTNTAIAQHFGIQGFPTIKLFPPNSDRSWHALPRVAVAYEGGRTKSDFVQFATQYVGKAVKVEQLLSQSQLDEECAKGVCLVAFVPHLLDSGVSARNDMLKTITDVLRASYSMPVKFFWSEGGEQFEFEDQLRLQFGFPAVVAINLEKNRYAIHKGTFEENALRSFITSLMAGRQAIDPLPKNLAKLKTTQPWDGKEAPKPEEDDEL